jgi:hypothetical protein
VAAATGDTEGIERLLSAGADANAQNRYAWTALHHAVARSHPQAAALLLARGADPNLPDTHGRTALTLRFTTREMLHAIRQRYHRLPDADVAEPSSEVAKAWASELTRCGIVRVSGLISVSQLAELRAEFDEFIRNLDSRLARGEGTYRHYDEEEHLWANDQAYVTNNAFKYSRALARVCVNDILLEAARLYLGKRPFIQRGMAFRYLPISTTHSSQFDWHHDMQEKRFKIMILLTDVGDTDQYMSYAVGSHQLFHPYAMFRSNACSLDYVRRHLPRIEVYRATGKAGDVFLFDTNGAHRGNRSEGGRVRDVFLVEYSADRSYNFGGDVDPELARARSEPDANPFQRLVAAPKKWEVPRRRASSWVESLLRVESWL